MDALQSQAMAQTQQRRRDVLKGSLQAALQRLKEEEFGYCMRALNAWEASLRDVRDVTRDSFLKITGA